MWEKHASPTLAALKSGKHVSVEKPMDSTVADCQAMVHAPNASNKYLMVRHICRFNLRYAAVKQEIESGRIGEIVSMYAHRNIPFSVREEVLNKIGPIIGDGIHDTDLMLWYTGTKAETAFAQTQSLRGLRYPDIA